MRSLLTKYKSKFLIFLVVLGPGLITAIADNDAAGVATYSLAGARFGYSILFILIPIALLLAITQEMGARIALVARKGLGDLIREYYGLRIAVLVFSILMIANLGSITANFAALKAIFTMFKLPVIPLLGFFLLLLILLVSKGSYKTNQRVFLFGIFFYFTYVVSAIKAHPNLSEAVLQLFRPSTAIFRKEFLIASISVLGTSITPWGQFFIQSYLIDKKLTVDKLKYSQLETYIGSFITHFFAFFIIIATAGTLFVNHIKLTSGEQAALAIEPFAGELTSILFGVGLLNAALMGITIISLTSAYAFSEFFGYVGSLDAPVERGRLFYGLFITQLLIGAIIVLLPFIDLFKIVFITQALNGFLLPFVFYFLLKITNNRKLMGEYANNKIYNFIATIASVAIIASFFVVLFSGIFKF